MPNRVEPAGNDSKEDVADTKSSRSETSIFSARMWCKRSAQDTQKLKVTMMQWNLLANGLNGLYGTRKEKTFVGISDEHLSQTYRVPLMLQEIAKWDCDILCFEEFDFWDNAQFGNGLRDLGYVQGEGRRKRWSPIPRIDPNLPADGVTIFYKQAKFDCHATHTTDERFVRTMKKRLETHEPELQGRQTISESELRQWFKSNVADQVIESLYEDIKEEESDDEEDDCIERCFGIEALRQWTDLPSPPISCGTLLIPKEDPSVKLYVMTTHLNSKKGADGEEVRLKQLGYLLSDPMYEKQMAGPGVHTFLVCDMNGSFQSVSDKADFPLAYPFLVGNLPRNANLPGSMTRENPNHMFKSATRDYENGDVELPWTSVKDRVEQDGEMRHYEYAIDFLFYPLSGWNVTKVSSIPSKAEIEDWSNVGGEPFRLPCEFYPSDHLAICAEFQLQ